jgi:hypothetical protein
LSTKHRVLFVSKGSGPMPREHLSAALATELSGAAAHEGPDSGQATVLLLLMLSTFLLAMMAFAVDLTSIWFHRQAAKSAADAACLAAASDMLAISLGDPPPGTGFTPGTNSDCASSPSAALCTYATYNGYNGTGLLTSAASNSVSWTFPSMISGVVTPTGPKAPQYPFLQVVVLENVKTTFMGLMGTKFQQVKATSQCGEVFVLSAPPLLVLDPVGAPSVSLSSAGSVAIKGGPTRSIQINSTSASAVSNGTVDTTTAGPHFTGGDIGVVGAQTAEPSGFNLGTGKWIPNALPYPDPFSTVTAPTTPTIVSLRSSGVSVSYQTDGCPNSNGYQEYVPGYYGGGIQVKNFTGIFLPGVYVVDGGFSMESNSVVRNGYLGQKQAVLTTDGVMFYMRSGAVSVKANSGGTVADSVSPTLLSCDGTLPPSVPSNPLNGSILNSQCVDDGTYATFGGTGTETSAGSRGLLFFQAHTNTANPGYSTQGGGALAVSGTEYFHNTSSTSTMHFGGNPNGTTYMVGYIVTDDIQMNGTPALTMVLSQKQLFMSLKVGLFE